MLGVGAGYFSTGTWFVAVGGAVNVLEDRWRLSSGTGYRDAKCGFYASGNDAGIEGIAIFVS